MKPNADSPWTRCVAFLKQHKRQAIIIAIIILLLLLLLFLLLRRPAQKPEDILPVEDSSMVASDASSSESETSSVSDTSSSDSSESIDSSSSEAADSEAAPSLPAIDVGDSGALATGYAPLDQLVSGILSKIITSGMTSTEKLNAIYSYVRNNMAYDMAAPTNAGVYDELLALGYAKYDAEEMTLAYDAATFYHGVCDHYAAFTLVLARAAGIPLWQYGGIAANGESHAWNIVIVDGAKYLVDTNFGRFLTPFSSSGYTEQQDGSTYFNFFKTTPPAVEERKISWLFNAGFGDQRFYGNSRGVFTQTATISHPLYNDPGALYPSPICPLVQVEGGNNTFSATVSSGGAVIETLAGQSGAEQFYAFSWYPPSAGSYVIEIVASSDGIFEGHYIIYVEIS